ncbi:phosphatidylinositol glycan class S [Klebsormidium nitens]|uniref:Phosphatidylinositol glycan class S n=1 Tax=Klebsormidium nitens TaxID=105231 RepID=A0A1Y1IPK6_KLENI|nr:phosphatidylinositol glycan class S [Klebsormidium nitens]|eukprot:GAQ90557.1 phosphatidylinositol glycan class S [Klebsormidium nitens]
MDAGGAKSRNDAISAEDMTRDSGRLVVAFIVAIGLFSGLPVWWKTTEVHRAPLPKLNLEPSHNPLPVHSPVIVSLVLLLSSTNGVNEEDRRPPSRMLEKLQQSLSGLSKERSWRPSGPMPFAADGSALLSFSLLNADPADWVFDWDFASAEEHIFAPLVQAISPVAELAVESQVLYYARSQVRPTWDPQHQAYIVPHSDLPFFVNSHEWHLDTSVASAGRSKLLHFAVYVPAADECPLHFKLPNGKLSPTDGFTVPSWGGVVVWNPPQCSRNASSDTGPRTIPSSELRRILAIQIGQLRTLFGLSATPKRSAEVQTLSPGPKGFAGWEVAALLRTRSSDDTREALSTLRSLSTLVSALSNMVVHDSIADQVTRALAAAGEAQTAMLAGSYEAAASAARNARAQAESAFFHPTLMSLLYFPSEHHMAIYMPLFLPVLVNVCAAVCREALRWGRGRCRRRLSETLSRFKRNQL